MTEFKDLKNMKLKTFHPVLLLVLFLALISSNSNKNREDKPDGKPLNILIVSADDLAYNSIGVFG